MDTSKLEILHDVPPYLRVYRDGTIERLFGTEVVPATYDHRTGVSSKDILILPETGVSARLYRPNLLISHQKLPLLIFFHGGGFFISSTADPKYHDMLNILADEAKIMILSVNYRLAPEHPLPTPYHDSWEALHWLALHCTGNGDEPWLNENVNFDKVFLGGDSCGANISHHMAMWSGSSIRAPLKFKIKGLLMIQPYFWGEEAIGIEAEDPVRRGMVNKWWEFVCPSDKGNNDTWINPFVDSAPSLVELACEKVLVGIAGKDILQERGRQYYQSLVKSKWKGKVELLESEGEDHVFHIIDPTCEKAVHLIKRCAKFINQE